MPSSNRNSSASKLDALSLSRILKRTRSTAGAPAAPTGRVGLLDLPDEIFFSSIFPYLFADDIVVLGWVNRQLHRLAFDNAFWRKRIKLDLDVPLVFRPEVYGEAGAIVREDVSGDVNVAVEITTDTKAARRRSSKLKMPDSSSSASATPSSVPDGHFRHLYFGIAYPRVFAWGLWDARIPLPDDADTYDDPDDGPVVTKPLDITVLFTRTFRLTDLHCLWTRSVCRNAQGVIRVWGRGACMIPTRAITGMSNEAAYIYGIHPKDTFSVSRRAIVFVDPKGDVYQAHASYAWHVDGNQIQQVWFEEPTLIPPRWPDGTIRQVTSGNHYGGVLANDTITIWSTTIGEEDTPFMLPAIPKRADWEGWIGSEVWATKRDEWEEAWALEASTAHLWQRQPQHVNSVALKASANATTDTVESEADSGEQVVRIAVGVGHIFALKQNGEVWWTCPWYEIDQWTFLPQWSRPSNYDIQAWGERMVVHNLCDAWPRMGLVRGIHDFQLMPPHVMWPSLANRPSSPVIQLALGGNHWVALTANGDVYSGGQNEHGCLAHGNIPYTNTMTPAAKVEFPEDDMGTPARVFSVSTHGALALGDGRLPFRIGRMFGDEPPIKLKMREPPKPPPKPNIFRRAQHRWRDFKLLRDTMDEHLHIHYC